jgi:hypothetical protein
MSARSGGGSASRKNTARLAGGEGGKGEEEGGRGGRRGGEGGAAWGVTRGEAPPGGGARARRQCHPARARPLPAARLKARHGAAARGAHPP